MVLLGGVLHDSGRWSELGTFGSEIGDSGRGLNYPQLVPWRHLTFHREWHDRPSAYFGRHFPALHLLGQGQEGPVLLGGLQETCEPLLELLLDRSQVVVLLLLGDLLVLKLIQLFLLRLHHRHQP